MDKATSTAAPQTVSIGDVVTGVVEQIVPYGAFVRLSNGQKAMVHISQLSHGYIKKVEDCLQLNQEIEAKVLKIDERGRIDLSIKVLQEPPAPEPRRTFTPAPRNQSAAMEGDDFERKLSQFMKISEEKNSSLMAKVSKSGRPARRKGSRP